MYVTKNGLKNLDFAIVEKSPQITDFSGVTRIELSPV
jgi:hypothetical protein